MQQIGKHLTRQTLRCCVAWIAVFVIGGVYPLLGQQKTEDMTAANNKPDMQQAQALLSENRTAFVENKGQITDSDGKVRTDIRFVATIGAMTVYFMPDKVCYVLTDPKSIEQTASYHAHERNGMHTDNKTDGKTNDKTEQQTNVFRFDMKLLHSRKDVVLRGESKAKGIQRYYTSTSPIQTESFQKVVYSNVYTGVDMVYYIGEQGLKYDFVVHPGGDYQSIAWLYEGADNVSLSADGELRIHTALGVVEEHIPLSYQTTDKGERVELNDVRFILDGTVCKLQVKGVNPAHELVIDPAIAWATYYGGPSSISGQKDVCTAVAADGNNAIIVVGWTDSYSFPVFLGLQTLSGGNREAFISKFTPVGTVIWATYYGGNTTDEAHGVTIDAGNNIYVVGYTNSPNFPVSGGFQMSQGGGYDAFILKIDPLCNLGWASYCGGIADDFGMDVAISSSNVPVFTGTTSSIDFPIVQPLQNQLNQTGIAATSDAFIVAASGTNQYFGSYFGGDGYDFGEGIIIDQTDRATITGYSTPFTTFSYPVFSAWQSTYGGGSTDAFLTQVFVPTSWSATPSWFWSTYFGSTRDDRGQDIALTKWVSAGSSSNLLAITGYSNSYTLTPSTCSKNVDTTTFDAIVYVFAYNAGVPISGRFFGGTNNDYGYAITRIGTSTDDIVIAGATQSNNLPLKDPFQRTQGTTEAFAARFDHAGCGLQWATYYGASSSATERAYGVCSDSLQRVVIVGETNGTGLPVRNAIYSTRRSTEDGFIAVFDETFNRFPTFLGGTGNDRAEDVATDYDNNVYIVGWTASNNFPVTVGAHQVAFQGMQDAFLAKFDGGGNRVWATYYGGQNEDIGTSIAVSGDVVIIGGYTRSPSNIATPGSYLPSAPTGAGYNGFLARFNGTGVQQWGTYIGGSGEDRVLDVALQGTSSIAITGYTSTTFPTSVFATPGAQQGTHGGGSLDAFVSKFNTAGTRLWSTYAGGTGNDEGHGISFEGGNRIVMVGGTNNGSTYPQYGTTSFVGTGWDAIVTKYYSNGSSPWSLVFGGIENETAAAVATQTTGLYGRIYIAGTTDGLVNSALPVGYSYTASQNADIFLVQFDSVGVRRRARIVNDNNGAEYADAVVAYQDAVLVAGQTLSTNLVPQGHIPAAALQVVRNGATDALVMAFDQYLANTDGTYFGGTGNEAGTGVALDTKGRVVLCGWSSSTSFGALYTNNTYWSYQPTNAGNEDAFISRFSLGMTNIAKRSDEFAPRAQFSSHLYECYPSPTNGLLTIAGTAQAGKPLEITITDMLGNIVLSVEETPATSQYTRTVDVGNLSTGMYFIAIRSGIEPAASMTFIKQ